MILACFHRDHDNNPIRIRHVEGGFRIPDSPGLAKENRIVQSLAPFSEAAVGEAMEVVMDLLLLGIVSACVFLTLAFLIAVAAGVVGELRRRGHGRNALPRRT